MAIIGDLLADPMGFLSENVLATKVNPRDMKNQLRIQPGQEATFCVRRTNAATVRYRTGSKFLGMGNKKETGEYYEILFPREGEPASGETFKAIWSGYSGGEATHCDLQPQGQADLMITAIFTGCTLAFSRNDAGITKVGHYNLKKNENALGDTLTANEVVTAVNGNFTSNPSVMTKEFYYGKAKYDSTMGGNNVGKRTWTNVFGIRKNGKWDFYAQYVESKGNALFAQIRGVDKLDAGAKYIS